MYSVIYIPEMSGIWKAENEWANDSLYPILKINSGSVPDSYIFIYQKHEKL